jgi:AcrR family transcriptional regulator
MKKKAEFISLADLARLAGVSRSAAYAWVASQEDRGARLVYREGRRSAMVDKHNPLIQAYIDNKATVLDNRSAKNGKGVSSSRSPDALRKMKNQIEKIELATAAQREKYISRSLAIACLEEYSRQHELVLRRMVDNIVRDINKEFKNKDPGKTRKFREIFDQPVNDSITMVRREIDNFIKETEPRHGKKNSLPAQE